MIETERLILRPFQKEDLKDVYHYLNQIKVHCFMDMKVDSLEEAKEALLQKMKDPEYYYAIELKEDHHVIGEIFSHPEKTYEEGACDTYSPCWLINEDYSRKGYMYEAAKAFINMLFDEKQARRVYIYTEDDNIPCQKLTEKLGFRKEGLFLEYVSFINDEDGKPIYENTYQYAILKKEWERIR